MFCFVCAACCAGIITQQVQKNAKSGGDGIGFPTDEQLDIFTEIENAEQHYASDNADKAVSKAASDAQDPDPTQTQRPKPKRRTEATTGEKMKTPKITYAERPESVDAELWNEWIATRKNKRISPPTPRAMAAMTREAASAGVPLEAAITECCDRGWAGFKAAWYSNSNNQRNRKPQTMEPIAPTASQADQIRAMKAAQAAELERFRSMTKEQRQQEQAKGLGLRK